jgi:hypothetical protein
MDEIRPTWRLAWGLWWRGVLITLGIAAVIWGIMFVLYLAGVIAMPWCGTGGWMPWGY